MGGNSTAVCVIMRCVNGKETVGKQTVSYGLIQTVDSLSHTLLVGGSGYDDNRD